MITIIRLLISVVLFLLSLTVLAQTKLDYLKQNRFDLNDVSFNFPEKDFKIIGLGAYHGSAKIEDVELAMINSLTKNGNIKYYLPETDFSVAHYYNEFMQTGDTLLLRDLVVQNGNHVPQERTIEVYERWKKLKQSNDKLPKREQLKVVGVDVIRNYKYTTKYILKLLDTSFNTKAVRELKKMIETDTTSYARGDLSYAHHKLTELIIDYELFEDLYADNIKDKKMFHHIISGIKKSMKKENREQTIYDNYLALKELFDFDTNIPFMRIGFWHLEKSREGANSNSPFFARLLENKIYPREKVVSVIGYYTNSEVVWDELYSDEGNYNGFTIEGGFGIGDYEKEYFRGIQNLKDAKISDKTMFRLNNENTPFADGNPDLIEIIMTDQKSNGENVKGMSTTDFLDYAILISNSKASVPIYELGKIKNQTL